MLLTLSAAAWIILILLPAGGGMALCHDPALGALDRASDRLRLAWQTGTCGRMLLGWSVMTLAMMLPLVGATLRQVAGRSFATRRRRALGEFLIGYLAVWTLIGLVAVPLAAAQPGGLVPAMGFVLAGLWQLTPVKALALRLCHRTMPLAPWGWRADRDCLRFGGVHGAACAGSCWPMMLACTLAPHALLAMACAQLVALSERQARVPAPRRTALALAGCALLG